MVGRALVPCDDLSATLDYFTSTLGFRIERISPADDPREVDVSGGGLPLRLVRVDGADLTDGAGVTLELDATVELHAGTYVAPNGTIVEVVERSRRVVMPELVEELTISRLADAGDFGAGRAGMGYRDLIPSRLGGRFIASHIRIAEGGDVPDYPHFHRIRFQLIYCRRGWVRVVYEDQGEPFVLHPGDCVIQPPEIRHRVLESSPGLEVVEIGCPAEHDTFADHEIELPTGVVRPHRDFDGQTFVRHVAADAEWTPWRAPGWEMRRAHIAEATDDLAEVRTIRPDGSTLAVSPAAHAAEFAFYFVLEGAVALAVDDRSEALVGGDSVVIPAAVAHRWSDPSDDLELLEVTLPATPVFSPAPVGE